MKKVLFLALLLVVLIAFVGCGQKEEATEEVAGSEEVVAETAVDEADAKDKVEVTTKPNPGVVNKTKAVTKNVASGVSEDAKKAHGGKNKNKYGKHDRSNATEGAKKSYDDAHGRS